MVCFQQEEPNLDWYVIDDTLDDMFWASEGDVVDPGGFIDDGERQWDVAIAQGDVGVTKELYVCSVGMCSRGWWEWRHHAGMVVFDQMWVLVLFYLCFFGFLLVGMQ